MGGAPQKAPPGPLWVVAGVGLRACSGHAGPPLAAVAPDERRWPYGAAMTTEPRTTTTLRDRVDRMTRTVLAAAMHHDLWSAHIRDTAQADTAVYRENLSELWSVTSLAHRFAFYVRAGALFIQHPKADSIPRLFRECRPHMDAELVADTERRITALGPRVRKIELLRNSVYAHQSARWTVREAYAEAKISLQDSAMVISEAIDIVNNLRSAVGLYACDIGREHIDQFFASMKAIEAAHSARLGGT
jgi:hypothetical protein